MYFVPGCAQVVCTPSGQTWTLDTEGDVHVRHTSEGQHTSGGLQDNKASDSQLDLIRAPYVMYGVKYIDPVCVVVFQASTVECVCYEIQRWWMDPPHGWTDNLAAS